MNEEKAGNWSKENPICLKTIIRSGVPRIIGTVSGFGGTVETDVLYSRTENKVTVISDISENNKHRLLNLKKSYNIDELEENLSEILYRKYKKATQHFIIHIIVFTTLSMNDYFNLEPKKENIKYIKQRFVLKRNGKIIKRSDYKYECFQDCYKDISKIILNDYGNIGNFVAYLEVKENRAFILQLKKRLENEIFVWNNSELLFDWRGGLINL